MASDAKDSHTANIRFVRDTATMNSLLRLLFVLPVSLLSSSGILSVEAFSAAGDTTTTTTTPPLKWLIVGGGPHGVHIATRLLEEVPAVSRSNLCIVDDEPQLLHKWKTRTAATGMTYLRSSASYHLDVREDSLRRYAEKKMDSSSGNIFAPDYKRPLLNFFNEHCDYVVQKNHLDEAHLQGMVIDIVPNEDHVQVQIRRPNGDVVEMCSENIVLALGSDAPEYPDWVDQETIRTGKVRHIFDDYDNGTRQFEQEDVDGDAGSCTSPRHRSIAVVGGGISAGHLALKLAREATNCNNVNDVHTTVHVICRHDLREQQFDTHQDWMMDSYAAKRSEAGGGQGVPECQRHFASLDSFVERRKIIQRERRAGTVSASVSRGKNGLRYAIQSERIRWHKGDINDMNEEEDGQLSLSLTSGKHVMVDEVILATGFGKRPPGSDLISGIARQRKELELCPCGYPAPDKSLRWHERIYLAGALAELELGPSARNIAGARLASERIVAAANASKQTGKGVGVASTGAVV